MNVWNKLPVTIGKVDIWLQLADDLQRRPPQPGVGYGIWEELTPLPGGLWRAAKDETLVLARNRADLWREVNDETLILERGQVLNLWHKLAVKALDPKATLLDAQQTGLWEKVDQETLLLARPQASAWQPPARNFARFKPLRARGWALKELATVRGETYYVLKNLRTGGYLKLSEQQVFLWNLMDGAHSVQDIAVANFVQYHTLSIASLTGFLQRLRASGFLVEAGPDVYRAAGRKLFRRTLDYWQRRAIGLLFQSELSFKKVDEFFTVMYRRGGRMIYTWPVQIVVLLATLAGLPAFFWLTQQGDLSLITGVGKSVGFGAATLFAAQLLAVFMHECAHALTTKHYGRQVRRGGVGLYFGMVAFFVDTTDIWMEPRRPRLAVTWAGPYTGFFLGGLASLLLLAASGATWAGFAYQFAAFCYGLSFLNLNPLLKLDGYYLLMDWLEMPMLRERSLKFVHRELLGKLRAREGFSHEEKVYAVFGVLALAWTALAVYSMVRLYGGMIFGWLTSSVGAPAAWAILILAVGYFAVRAIRHRLCAR